MEELKCSIRDGLLQSTNHMLPRPQDPVPKDPAPSKTTLESQRTQKETVRTTTQKESVITVFSDTAYMTALIKIWTTLPISTQTRTNDASVEPMNVPSTCKI